MKRGDAEGQGGGRAPSWQAICLACGVMSPVFRTESDAQRWEATHVGARTCCPDVVIQLACTMPGGGQAWFFG